jgi:hypothetical protein
VIKKGRGLNFTFDCISQEKQNKAAERQVVLAFTGPSGGTGNFRAYVDGLDER